MKEFRHQLQFYGIWPLITALVIGSTYGCAGIQEEPDQEVVAKEQEIELLDPVGVASAYDVAGYRNIYNASVSSCIVVPAVTEFEYTTDEPFFQYGRLPGEEVNVGDVLIYGDTVSLDESYDRLAEEIADKTEDYEDSMSDLQEDLYDAKKAEYEASVPYGESFRNMPETGSPGYDLWAARSMPAEAAYKVAVMAREKIEQSMKEKEELFAVEQEYDSGRLERMGETIGEAQITSNTEGTVVAINAYMSGDSIQKNTDVIAVGNMDQKVLRVEYVSKSKVEKAEDVYALIDGKRYEVTYEVMEKEEYARLKKLNDVVYSTFYLEDPENEIPMGKFATLVIIEESGINTLAVMADALHRDGQDYYCYVFDGTNSVTQSVTIGLTDGKYTEILSGLKEGDQVLVSEPVNGKDKFHTLESGAVGSEYSGSGYLYYPATEWIMNPAKIGTFYLKEICVEQYQQVQEGDPLVKIEVISDEISISRVERKIERQQERLSTLLEKKSKIYSDEVDRSLDRAIESRQKAIEDLKEELAELTEYSGEVTLTAPYACIITGVSSLEEGDLISYNQKLVQIADQSQCYIVVNDQDGQLSYGNEAVITYVGEGSIKKEIKGTVVSVNKTALSKQLQTGFALIRISEEDIGNIAKYGSAVGSGGWNRSRFGVTVPIREVNHVVLVPKKAVTVYKKNTFVKVKKPDGSFTYVSFISGGSDQENYWVVEGLDEGMEVCLE